MKDGIPVPEESNKTGTAFLLDMDGVLYHGDRVLPGAHEFMRTIDGYRFLFITNNPVHTAEQVAARLEYLGFDTLSPDHILTSAQATALWLSQQKKDFRYFAIGAEGLDMVLSEKGQPDPESADFVVVGEGPGLEFDNLTTGINLILSRGAQLISTNPDTTVDAWCHGRHLVWPGGGALVAPFEAATGKKAITIGKPHNLMYEMAMQRMGVPAASCIMIGDRPDTDIAGAAALGIASALVRTGRFLPGEPWPRGIPKPDWDVCSLTELARALQDAGVL